MLVMIMEKVPASLRGELTRWLIEPKACVFVGKVSKLVRDKLWKKAVKGSKKGSVVQIWASNNEQGFECRVHGEPSRMLVDMDGLMLVKIIN